MARAVKFLLGLMTSAVLVGCQNTAQTATLPKPNFAGPVVLAPPPKPPMKTTPLAPPRPAPGVKPPAAVPAAWTPPVRPRAWQWVIVHHSATRGGGAVAFDRMHRDKGWDELGYDFVIGNGTDTPDGAIEVGSRWTKQKIGAHTKTPDNRYNEYGIGICLVGNFDETRPTAKQLASLAKLIAYLGDTYRIRTSDIIRHRDTKATDCPGNNLSIAQVRQMSQQLRLRAELPADQLPTGELLTAATPR